MKAPTAPDIDDARQEMEAILFAVTHDLRAPLRAMHGFATALEEDCGDRLDDTGKEYLGRIVAATQRMDLLLQDLVTYNRLGRANLTIRPVPLGDVVAAALTTLGAE